MSGTVWLYNPLPEALRHYERELLDVLAAAGITARSAQAPSVEVSGGSAVGRIKAALTELAAHPRRGREPGHILVCWPTYGLLEPALWLPAWRGSTVSIVVHDPTPLRRQLGMGPVAATVGGRAARASHLRVVAHTELAAARLRELGWADPVVLPHPLLRPAARPGSGVETAREPRRSVAVAGGAGEAATRAPIEEPGRHRAPERPRERGTVLVCGQYKPARNVSLLAGLGPLLRGQGYRTLIAGRGWPSVMGWDSIDRFLSEEELDQRIGESAAVLVPYERFYQSGIAVRAVELGVPVVGPHHPFLTELLGGSWPGLVDSDRAHDWAEAVGAVAGRTEALARVAGECRERCEEAWARYLRPTPVR